MAGQSNIRNINFKGTSQWRRQVEERTGLGAKQKGGRVSRVDDQTKTVLVMITVGWEAGMTKTGDEHLILMDCEQKRTSEMWEGF